MESRNVIAEATKKRVLENGCDCLQKPKLEGGPSHYVEHYCGYKREYPHR